MKSGTVIMIVVALALALCGCQFVGERNKFTTEHEGINAAFAQVDIDLQRRGDLIPNLVETVKGYAKEETQVIQSVADARAALGAATTPSDKFAANDKLTGALGRMLVLVENYPNLKANKDFKQLMFSLEGSENRITQSRHRYNEALQKYNTDISLFPGNVVATLCGFQRQDAYFKTEPGARTVPKVQF